MQESAASLDTGSPTTPPDEDTTTAPDEEASGAPGEDLLDGGDPFLRPLPEPLAALATRLEAGDGLDRDAHRDTRVYQRLHPNDPRPTLLLAHDLAARASWPQAVERYELAYSRWPETVGDPRMLSDLVQAAVQGEEAASSLIVMVFGEDAAEAVEERLAHSEHRPTRALLRRLLDQLREP